jgi:hypothetical protein
VPLQDVVETFLDAVAERDLRVAATFLTPELKQAVTNVPYARDAYLYRIEQITWQINNIYAEKDGLACAAVLSVTWKGTANPDLNVILFMDLKRMPPRNRWYITGITAQCQIQQKVLNSSLPDFIRQFDSMLK